MLLRSDEERIRHMIDAIRMALDHAEGQTFESITRSQPLQQLFIRSLEILGEAAARVSEPYRHQHPEIPWRSMISIRNRLIHGYFEIELSIVWTTITDDLPEILGPIEALLRDHNE